jgi:hypothetical protein
MSAEKMSGKTRALEVTEPLVNAPLRASSVTPAAMVRLVDSGLRTVLLDEIDSAFGSARAREDNAGLQRVLNDGYRRGAKVALCVGTKNEPKEFNAFAPVAIAGLRELPDTLASRAIFIRMKRRAPNEQVEPFRYRYHVDEAKPIAEALADWCSGLSLAGAEPELPEGIEDRSADCWEPLLAIADVAGNDWPNRARQAAIYLTNRSAEETLTAGVELLAHIREAFGSDGHLATAVLLDRLKERDESPWRDIRGKPLDDRGLARRLKGYGIKSRNVRIGERVPKGYAAEDFHDAWSRYLPLQADERHKGYNRYSIDNENKDVADVAPVAQADDFDGDPFASLKDPSYGLTDELDVPAFLRRGAA